MKDIEKIRCSQRIKQKTVKEEEKNRDNYKNNQETNNKMAVSTYLSIITLNANGLNAPIKT